MTRSNRAIINEFGIEFALEKKNGRGELSREGGKENDGSPYGTMALFPAITRLPVTLRILLYLPVCRRSPLPSPFQPLRDVRGSGGVSRTHRIYFIKPFSKLPPAKVPRNIR